MAATKLRLGLLALTCCLASRVDAQNYASPGYATPPNASSQTQPTYTGMPAWPERGPQPQPPAAYEAAVSRHVANGGQYPTTLYNQQGNQSATNRWQPTNVSNVTPPAANQTFFQHSQQSASGSQPTYFTHQRTPSPQPVYGQTQTQFNPPQFNQPPAQQPTFQPQATQQYASVGGGVAPVPPQQQYSPPPIESFSTQGPQDQGHQYRGGQYYEDTGYQPGIAGCGDFGCNGAADRRWFVRYDYMHWTITPPKSSLIGNTQLEGDYTRGGVTTNYRNSLDTSFVDWEWESANRVEFGARNCNNGWMIGLWHGSQTQSLTSSGVTFLPAEPGFPLLANSYLAGYADGNGDNIDDDLNGNNRYGRNGEDIGTPNGTGVFIAPFDGTPDVPAPTDTGDLQIYLPIFADVTVQNKVSLNNFEIMYTTKMNNLPQSDFELLYGFRYFELEDQFGFNGTGGILDATSFSVDSQNQLLGLQLGARWTKCFGPMYLNAEGRFFAAANLQDNKMFGSLATNIATTSNGRNGPINLTPQAFNYNTSDNAWAPMGEYRLHAILPVNGFLAFRFGYTGFVVGGISRASQKVDYVLPRLGLNRSASDETIVYNSFDFGFELTH